MPLFVPRLQPSSASLPMPPVRCEFLLSVFFFAGVPGCGRQGLGHSCDLRCVRDKEPSAICDSGVLPSRNPEVGLGPSVAGTAGCGHALTAVVVEWRGPSFQVLTVCAAMMAAKEKVLMDDMKGCVKECFSVLNQWLIGCIFLVLWAAVGA